MNKDVFANVLVIMFCTNAQNFLLHNVLFAKLRNTPGNKENRCIGRRFQKQSTK